ncbi:hypothetical protein OG728_37660 [Streptomyces microflavus]|uniref:hypothetical protein n=1 Tax=Streptomyces microflavus TaxID=1919 RepID=UPI002E168902|nr:hypothetical protein OG728_37660 [Streptomyces microflavus]
MNTIDDLLARSLLLRDPQIPSDTVPYDDTALVLLLQQDEPSPRAAGRPEASYLKSLCEVVVTRSTPQQITDFITDQIPAPRSAWILGCLLQLAHCEDGARFWWQYAAGAGVGAAAYCLYLHHRVQGDSHAASFWHDQADTDRTGIRNCLRILDRLTPAGAHTYSEAAQGVMAYVAKAVSEGYDRYPEYEIPLPGPYFAEKVEIILAATSSAHTAQPAAQPAADLPPRPEPAQPDDRGALQPDQVRVEVAASDAEFASAVHTALATCWKGYTLGRAPAKREEHRSDGRLFYYLDRVPAS